MIKTLAGGAPPGYELPELPPVKQEQTEQPAKPEVSFPAGPEYRPASSFFGSPWFWGFAGFLVLALIYAWWRKRK